MLYRCVMQSFLQKKQGEYRGREEDEMDGHVKVGMRRGQGGEQNKLEGEGGGADGARKRLG